MPFSQFNSSLKEEQKYASDANPDISESSQSSFRQERSYKVTVKICSQSGDRERKRDSGRMASYLFAEQLRHLFVF